ncbi:glycosyl hydrolase family 65 protein [Nocardia sp. NBC_01009]|uniref:glycosyl hydrolase family 65 protein n=1 Tax=Nocardia sp. NBC_01009 TaxID=2975996 RepID=UPI00386EDBCC
MCIRAGPWTAPRRSAPTRLGCHRRWTAQELKSLGVLSFPILYRGHGLTVRVSGDSVEIGSDLGTSPPIEIDCRGQIARLSAGDMVRLPMNSTPRPGE